MDPHTITMVNVINELWNMQHAQDWKLIASFAAFLMSFITANFLFYDVIRGQRRKLAGTPMHNVIVTLAVLFYLWATFCFARTIDGVQDLAFLLANPEVVTTLSQRSVILEIPLMAVAVANLTFFIFYVLAYLKMPYANGDKK